MPARFAPPGSRFGYFFRAMGARRIKIPATRAAINSHAFYFQHLRDCSAAWHNPCINTACPVEGIFTNPALQGLHLAMDDAALRQQAISSNVANINTPGYQRMDVSSSFQQAFTDALNRLSDGQTVDSMPQGTIETAAVQGPARPDGNTVQLEDEMVDMANNGARYEFAGQMLAQNYHGLKYAMTGQSS
ncbi:MAG: flagellar basal body rod protein FlgB [Verrucomicrobiota bacterium]